MKKKDLQNLKEDLETFHEFDEHIYYIDLQNRLKKEAKMPEKKSKIPPKPKPRLPLMILCHLMTMIMKFQKKWIQN